MGRLFTAAAVVAKGAGVRNEIGRGGQRGTVTGQGPRQVTFPRGQTGTQFPDSAMLDRDRYVTAANRGERLAPRLAGDPLQAIMGVLAHQAIAREPRRLRRRAMRSPSRSVRGVVEDHVAADLQVSIHVLKVTERLVVGMGSIDIGEGNRPAETDGMAEMVDHVLVA